MSTLGKVLDELRERLEDALAGPEFSRDQTKLDERRLRNTKAAQVELENLRRACRTVVANGYTADMRAKGLDTSAAILEAAAREAP